MEKIQNHGPDPREAIYKNYFDKKQNKSFLAVVMHHLKYWSSNCKSVEVREAKEFLLTKTMLLNLTLCSKRLIFSIFGLEEWQKYYDDP